jgi:hypothetical protein
MSKLERATDAQQSTDCTAASNLNGAGEGIDGHAGAEVARLIDELGSLVRTLAEGRGNEKLLADTTAFVDGHRVLLSDACSSCADRLRRDAFADAVMPQTIERPANDRRSDFLLRVVVAFYPHGVVEKVNGQSLALPRHSMGRMGQFLRDMLGTLPYADLNADCSRLISRFPGVPDRGLRAAMFAHPPSRVLLMKVLVRLLRGFQNLDLVRQLFIKRVTCRNWPNIFAATNDYFKHLCDGLFGEFTLQLQSPREGDDLDQWFGLGATLRVLDLLEGLVEQQAA